MKSDKSPSKKVEETEVNGTLKNLICGIVMPISEIDGCNESHWQDVQGIITESVLMAGFSANLVSNADDVGVIQKRIIQNLYENPVVIVDVSGKNPNVMLELGLRLAFDKPTIIIKDDRTSYSFDTSPIEHLEYPRDLRFTSIVKFKEKLSFKIKQTYEKAKEDPEFSTFLKHFGSFKVAKIETEVVSKEDIILEELKFLREVLSRRDMLNNNEELSASVGLTLSLDHLNKNDQIQRLNEIRNLRGVKSVEHASFAGEELIFTILFHPSVPRNVTINAIKQILN